MYVSRIIQQRSVPLSAVFLEDIQPTGLVNTFRLDTNSDPNNFTYGSLYKQQIAKRHKTESRCLGMVGGCDWLSFGGKKNSKHKKDGIQRYYHGKKVGRKHDACGSEDDQNGDGAFVIDNELMVKCTGSRQPVGDSLGSFVPLEHAESRDHSKKSDAVESQLINSQTVPLESTDLVDDLRSQMEPGSHSGYMRSRSSYYNRELGLHPDKIDLWLEFVAFQDEVLQHGDHIPGSKEAHDHKLEQKRALVDVKLSILDKALKKNPSSIRLKVMRMEFLKDVRDVDELIEEWKTILFAHPNSSDVWHHYLGFVEAHFSSFTVSGLVKAYLKCLSTLKKIQDGQLRSHPPLPQHLEHIIGKCGLHFHSYEQHDKRKIKLHFLVTELCLALLTGDIRCCW